MAYDATVTKIERGNGEWVIRIEEVDAGPSDYTDFRVGWSDFDIIQVEAALDDGTGTTIQPDIQRHRLDDTGGLHLLWEADSAVEQQTWTFITPVLCQGKKFRHESNVDANSDNVIWTEYTIRVR